jgi:hypothetical protein
VPALVMEADSHDSRLFSDERLQMLLTEFLEPQLAHHGPGS